jgi:hypothetical protein
MTIAISIANLIIIIVVNVSSWQKEQVDERFATITSTIWLTATSPSLS